MDTATLVGSAGVALLLLAFFLSLFKFLPQDGVVYIGMNILGAGLAGVSSWMIQFMPFVILEGVWCLVALAALFKWMGTNPARAS